MAERGNPDRVQQPLGSQPVFHDSAGVDALNAMVLVALLGDVMVLRDRLMPARCGRNTTPVSRLWTTCRNNDGTGPTPAGELIMEHFGHSALYLRNMNGGWRNDGRGHTIVAHVRDFYPDLDVSAILDLGCSVGHSMIAIAAGCPDASFDLITSSVVLHETSASAMRAIFAECHRLLRPGGVMVNLEVPSRREHLDLWEQMRCDFESHYNKEPFMAAMSRTDFADVARRAGFRPAEITVGYRHGVAEPRAERSDSFTAGDPEGRNMLGSWYVRSARKVQA